ncbi:MAG: hypothetical protein NTY86_13735 [Deltaproteobacteria bacterium]|nr:hypothetical protein [Deltaproteobacteria bacterium]
MDLFQDGPVFKDIGVGVGDDPVAQVTLADGGFQSGYVVRAFGAGPEEGVDLVGHRVRLETDLRAIEERLQRLPVETVGRQTFDERLPVGGRRPDRSEQKQQKNDSKNERENDPDGIFPDAL